MFSAEPASRQAHTQQSGLCPHIIGHVRLWVYHGAVTSVRSTGLACHNHLHSQRLS
jgi:hypothetical protein